MTDEKGAGLATGNELVAQLQVNGALVELFAKIDSGEVASTGSDGLLKGSLERRLQAELTEHLGYGGANRHR